MQLNFSPLLRLSLINQALDETAINRPTIWRHLVVMSEAGYPPNFQLLKEHYRDDVIEKIIRPKQN